MEIPVKMRNRLKKSGKIVLLIVAFCIVWSVIYNGIMSFLLDLPNWLIDNLPLFYADETHVGRTGLATFLAFGSMYFFYWVHKEIIKRDELIYYIEINYGISEQLQNKISMMNGTEAWELLSLRILLDGIVSKHKFRYSEQNKVAAG